MKFPLLLAPKRRTVICGDRGVIMVFLPQGRVSLDSTLFPFFCAVFPLQGTSSSLGSKTCRMSFAERFPFLLFPLEFSLEYEPLLAISHLSPSLSIPNREFSPLIRFDLFPSRGSLCFPYDGGRLFLVHLCRCRRLHQAKLLFFWNISLLFFTLPSFVSRERTKPTGL